MIKSGVCVNCICLPMCRNKTDRRMLRGCKIVQLSMTNIFNTNKGEFSEIISYIGLDRTFILRRSKYGHDSVFNYQEEYYNNQNKITEAMTHDK